MLVDAGMSDADVTVLTNGNYVITANRSGADPAIEYRILDSAGGNVVTARLVTGTEDNNQNDREASVTALAGGGFVVAWTNTDVNDTDVQYRVYNAAGVQAGSGLAGTSSSTNDNNEPDVVGLTDGTFVIVFDNDELNRVDVEHFSAAGSSLGVFNFDGAGTTLSAISLADGRFAVTWSDPTTGEISLEFLDTRDVPNYPPVYTPNDRIIGTIFADSYIATPTADSMNGWDGNDILNGAGGADIIYGDDGGDQLYGGLGDDLMFGGANSDLIVGGGGSDTAGFFLTSPSLSLTRNADDSWRAVSIEGADDLLDIDKIQTFSNTFPLARLLTGDFNGDARRTSCSVRCPMDRRWSGSRTARPRSAADSSPARSGSTGMSSRRPTSTATAGATYCGVRTAARRSSG